MRSLAIITLLILLGISQAPSRVYGDDPTPTAAPIPLTVGQITRGTLVGSDSSQGQKSYSLTLTYGEGGTTNDVVILFTSQHFAFLSEGYSDKFSLKNGSFSYAGGGSGGGGGVPGDDPPTSWYTYIPVRALHPDEISDQFDENIHVMRPASGNIDYTFHVYSLPPTEPIEPGATVSGTFTAAAPFKSYTLPSFPPDDYVTAYLEEPDPRGRYLWVRAAQLKWFSGDSANEKVFGQGIYALALGQGRDNSYRLMAGGLGAYRLHVDLHPIQTIQSGSYDVSLTYKSPVDIRVLNGHKGDKFNISAVGQGYWIVVYQAQDSNNMTKDDGLASLYTGGIPADALPKDFTLTSDDPVYIVSQFPDATTRDDVMNIKITLASK